MRRALRIGLAVAAVLIVLLVGVVYWIVATPGGARVVLDRVAVMMGKGTTIEGVEGNLGGPLRVRLIVIDRPDLKVRVEDVDMDTSALRTPLVVRRLHVGSVEVRTATSQAAARVPLSFKPPLAVRLEDGLVRVLRIGKIGDASHDVVLRDIVLKGEGDDRHWTIEKAAVVTEYGAANVAGTIASASPFDVDLRGGFEGKVQERALNVTARLAGTLKTLQAEAQGEVAGMKATARAALEPFAATPLKSLALAAPDVDLAAIDATLPRTHLAVSADLVPNGADGFAGPVRVANANAGPWDRQQLPFSSASARIAATAERVELADLAVALAGGGTASGRATLRKQGVEAELKLDGVDLAALHGKLQATKLAGDVTAAGDGASQRFDVSLKDPRFAIEGRATHSGGRVDVASARIVTGGGSVDTRGSVGLKGKQDFRFEGTARHFDPSAFVKTEKGDLNFDFVATGTLAGGVAGDVKADIAPSTYGGMPASGRVRVAGDTKRIAAADVDVAWGEAHLAAKGSLGRAGDAMNLDFRVPNLSAVAKPFGVALAGSAEGTARITGTFKAPAGSVNVTGRNLALPSNVRANEVVLRAEAGVDPDSAVTGDLRAAGLYMGAENPPTLLAQTAHATLSGTRRAHRLEVDAQVARDARLRAAFAGGVDPRAAAIAWDGRVETLTLSGRGSFALAAPTPLHLSAARIELGDATLKGEWGEARLETTRWTPRTLDLKGATPGLAVQSVARTFRATAIPRSDLVIAGDWDIHSADSFNGSVSARRVSGDVRIGDPPVQLGVSEMALRLDAVNGRAKGSVELRGDRIGHLRGEATGMIVRGASGWEFSREAPLDGRVVAAIPDLSTLAPWLGADSKLTGKLDADVAISGTGADPRVTGRAQAVNLSVREPQSGFEISQGEVALRMDGRRVEIEKLVARTPWHVPERAKDKLEHVKADADGGTITAQGSIDVAARRGAITVKADKVPVTQLSTRFLAISGDARLEAGNEGIVATGALRADAGWIGALDTPAPSLSEDVVVLRPAQPAPAEEAPAKEPMKLDVRFALGDHVYFEGRGLDTRLAGEMHVTGEVGSSLRATGVIRTVGGTYQGYGQKLAIERGVLSFNGAVDNPQLNVLALRKGLPVEAGVDITGTTTRPRVRLVSTPDVPEPEKLSWLVLGRGASDATPGDTSVMMAAASALLGNNNPGSDLGKKFGIDEVKIGRSDAGSVLGVLPQSTVAGRTGTPSAAEVVSVGKRINNRLQLNFEQGLADAEGTLKLTVRISHQFQILARAGYLPGVDAVYRWTFK